MLIIQPMAATVPGKHENLLPGVRSAAEFKTGQLLNAITLSNTRDGIVQLRIGTTELTAHTSVSLPRNTNIALQVVQLQPQLLFRIMHAPDHIDHQVQIPQPLRQAMLNLLPKQDSLAQLFSQLGQVNVTRPLGSELTALQPLIRQIMNALPSRSDMTRVDNVRRAIQDSGVFLEARLATEGEDNKPVLTRDLKALLSRLQAALVTISDKGPRQAKPATVPSRMQEIPPPPPPLRGSVPVSQPRVIIAGSPAGTEAEMDIATLPQKAEAALSRIGLLQVATAENFNDGQIMWQLEIPVRHENAIDIVALTIGHERDDHDETSEHWVVNLALDLEHLGVMKIRITLDQDGISSSFRAVSQATRSLIENSMSELRDSIALHGLRIKALSCTADASSTLTTEWNAHSLIDEQV